MWPFTEMVKIKFSGQTSEVHFQVQCESNIKSKIKTLKLSSLILKPLVRATNTITTLGRKPSWEHSVPQGPMKEGNVSTFCYLSFDPCAPEIKCSVSAQTSGRLQLTGLRVACVGEQVRRITLLEFFIAPKQNWLLKLDR